MSGGGGRSLRVWIAVACALSLAAGAAVGYRAGRRPERVGNTYLQRLADEYDLRDDQIDAVAELLEREEEAIDSILERVAADIKDQVRRARLETEEAIRSVLDPEQRRRYDAARGR